MLREAGATEVHVRISSPPVKWPCFYGIDFATRAELIANGLDVDEIAASVGADSLGYISLEGMIEATKQPAERLCQACFTGKYPIELPDERAARQAPARVVVVRRRPARAQQPLIAESERLGATRTDRLRRRRRLHRGGRQGRRADEDLGREGQPARGDRRHRRLRRALRRQRAEELRPTAARHLGRRRRHQGRHRPGDGQARHHRLRPGRHARRRPGRLRRRAAVPDRLHRHRPGRARAHRRDRQGHRRGVRRGRLRADRRRDGRAPRACSSPTSTTSPARPPAWSRPSGCSAPAGSGPATWWSRWPRAGCTPTATRWSVTSCSTLEPAPAGRSTATSPSWGAPSARSCSSRPASTPSACLDLADRLDDRVRGARDVARHRRRAGRQPGARAAGRADRHHRPRDLDPRRRSSTWCARWAAYPWRTSR